MKNITLQQKKIIIVTLILFLIFSLVLFFIYLPLRNRVNNLKAELSASEREITEIESVIKETSSPDDGLVLLRRRFKELSGKFPDTEEDCFNRLSELAKKSNIEVTDFNPDAKKPVIDENGKELTLEGKVCQKITVHIKMKGSYKDLVFYMYSLEEKFPALVAVRVLRASKDAAGSRGLNINLEIDLFLLS